MDDAEIEICPMEGTVQGVEQVNKKSSTDMVWKSAEELVVEPSGRVQNHRNVPYMGSWVGLKKEQKRKALRVNVQGDTIVPLDNILMCSEHRLDSDVSEKTFAARLAVELAKFEEEVAKGPPADRQLSD